MPAYLVLTAVDPRVDGFIQDAVPTTAMPLLIEAPSDLIGGPVSGQVFPDKHIDFGSLTFPNAWPLASSTLSPRYRASAANSVARQLTAHGPVMSPQPLGPGDLFGAATIQLGYEFPFLQRKLTGRRTSV